MSHARKKIKAEVLEGKNHSSKTKIERLIREGILIITIAVAIFLLLALISYHAGDPGWSSSGANAKIINLGGRVGAWFADVFLCAFGYIAYIFPFMLVYAAWLPFKKQLRAENSEEDDASSNEEDEETNYFARIIFIFRSVSFFLILIAGSALAAASFHTKSLPFNAGGILGNIVNHAMVGIFNQISTVLILLAVFLAALTTFSGISLLKAIDFFGFVLLKIFNSLRKINFRDHLKEEEETISLKKIKIPLAREQKNEDKPIKPEIAEVKAKPIITVPKIIKPGLRSEQERQTSLFEPDLENSFPSLSLLDLPAKTAGTSYSQEQLEAMSREVELRLKDFGIDAQVVAVHPGPVVTRFELELAAGTKVSRITALAKDLARSLSVVSVRIVEVIPGKSVIGLELPNQVREVVRLREVLASQQYDNTRAALALALGKDISGNPIIVDLARMPHLLVAGTTGSGKSVCLNAILLSLVYKYTAKELRMIMIDPKMLELSIYEGISHLLTPVVTNMKEAANALRWCVMEMERRYRLMMSFGVRNISGYNNKIREARNKGKPLLDPFWSKDNNPEKAQPDELTELPYIVVIADEYADMIMVVGKKVEELIARIAQKARAAGIHLILATQRPSVDVITGLIKANIPARIAFQVSSKIDSRTILDQSGAEQLLGYGDMLYLAPGTGIPSRIHGAFVADEEVHKVVSDLRRRGKPEYMDEILEGSGMSKDFIGGFDDASGESQDSEQDPLYDEAVKIVTETRKISISSIQRRFKIGYNRAARIVEAMEAAGVVSAMESNGNREVLAPAFDRQD